MVYKYGENFRLKTLDFSENEEMNKQVRDIINEDFDDIFLTARKWVDPASDLLLPMSTGLSVSNSMK